MSDNPFHDAIQPGPEPPTRVVDHPHFFAHVREQEKLKQQARNMTRQQLFDNGLLTVEDLDDEELRLGRCRDSNGRIPKVTKTMEMVPRDLYDEMVAEHLQRTKEKFRQQLDDALNVMAEVMTDPACEAKDRTDAAKYIIERVMGKSVERVAVSVTKEPWEELLGDVAHITRAQHLALKEGAIDAEVVEEVDISDTTERDERTPVEDIPTYEGPEDPRIRSAEPAPSFDNLATSNPVAPKSLSEQIREAQDEAKAIAEARAARKKLIQDAKKRRFAQRASGADVLRRNISDDAFSKAQERLSEIASWPPAEASSCEGDTPMRGVDE